MREKVIKKVQKKWKCKVQVKIVGVTSYVHRQNDDNKLILALQVESEDIANIRHMMGLGRRPVKMEFHISLLEKAVILSSSYYNSSQMYRKSRLHINFDE